MSFNLSGLGNFITNSPEQFAIMADKLGQGFDPNNPFAGIGSMMGQSSLANKALNEDKTRQDEIIKAIMGVTAPGTPGPTSVTVKAGKDGKGKVMTTVSDVADNGLEGPITNATPAAVPAAPTAPIAPTGQMQNIKDLISSPF